MALRRSWTPRSKDLGPQAEAARALLELSAETNASGQDGVSSAAYLRDQIKVIYTCKSSFLSYYERKRIISDDL